MSSITFDSKAFASDLGAALKPFAMTAGEQGKAIVARIELVAKDVEATLDALQSEQNPARRAALQQDLETYLPARKTFILSASASMLASDAQGAFEAAVGVAIKVAVAVAKSLVPIPLPFP